MIHAIEEETVREKQAADDIVKKMPPEKQAKYAEMKAVNEELLQVGVLKKKKKRFNYKIYIADISVPTG